MLDKQKTVKKNLTQKLNKVEKKNKIEYGGPKGLEPTRYGDWEVKGRVSDF
jgi:hypothetical protein